jgi:predicted aldo/keto reductase-like oxidoreductase
MNNRVTRRGFFSALPAVAAGEVLASTQSSSATGMPTRLLGKTGVRVSILGLGGHHAARPKEESDSFRLIHAAIDEGLTFMDNAWEYHNGRAEEVMGRALAMDGKREKAFLMTKVCARDYAGAMQQLEESLKRLRTSHIDLWQFHECNYFNDAEYLLEKGGLKAALEAKKQGKVRFIGFTGHKAPAIHNKILALNFPWDAVQLPNNVMDARFQSFRAETMPLCLKKGAGVVGMKGCGGDGRMLQAGIVTVEECYRYCLSQPVSVQVVGLAEMDHLREAVRIARSFQPMTQAEMTALMAKVREPQGDGRFELFKTTQRFDSGYHRQQHGFDLR